MKPNEIVEKVRAHFLDLHTTEKAIYGVAAVVIVFLLLCRGCDCSPIGDVVSTDSVTTKVTDKTTKKEFHSDKTDTVIREHVVTKLVKVPEIVYRDYKGTKVDPKDSCSPVIIDSLFQRDDGGVVQIIATVNCRNDSVHIVKLWASPVQAKVVYLDTNISRVKFDSIVIEHLRDSVYSQHKTLTELQKRSILDIDLGVTYDPFWSHQLSLGPTLNINLSKKWTIGINPAFNTSIPPNLPADIAHILQGNILLTYHWTSLYTK